MLKLPFLIFTLFVSHFSAQLLDIRVFSNSNIQNLSLKSLNGDYQLQTSSGFLSWFPQGTQLDLSINSSNRLHVSLNGEFLTIVDSLLLYQGNREDYLHFFSSDNRFKTRKYQGDFKIVVNDGNMQLVNRIPLDSYLEGVLASEAGVRLGSEYYKVQAIISRTYALNNLNKHKQEGFNLCDEVHCQAYYGRYEGESNEILEGISQTKGLILVDSAHNKFPVFFSANCGGQSAETDQIWNTAIPEYVSHVDTFCIHTRQATWEKYVYFKDFLNFLRTSYFFDVENRDLVDQLINYKPEGRKTFLLHPYYGIPLRDIRKEFGLKSTYFELEMVGDKLLFKGKGFGHGVGLCQEGAMNMIKYGKSFEEVLSYYFGTAKLTNYIDAFICR